MFERIVPRLSRPEGAHRIIADVTFTDTRLLQDPRKLLNYVSGSRIDPVVNLSS